MPSCKLLISIVSIIILYKFTIGYSIRQIEMKLDYLQSKDSITSLKSKLRDEIKNSLNKDRYISEEDAKLINAFLNKIKKELSESE